MQVHAFVIPVSVFYTTISVLCHPDTSSKVDVMLLYTEDARDRLGGVSDSQMETIISVAFSSSKEAMKNSNIDLSLRLVHVQLIEVCGGYNIQSLPDESKEGG